MSSSSYSVHDLTIYNGLSPELIKALQNEFMNAEMEEVEEGTRIVLEDNAYILKDGVFVNDVPEEKNKKKATAPKEKKSSKKVKEVEEAPKPKKKGSKKAKAVVEAVEKEEVVEKNEEVEEAVEKDEEVEEAVEKDEEVVAEAPKPKAKKTPSKKTTKKPADAPEPEPEPEIEADEKKSTRKSPFTLDDLINAINTNKTAAALKMVNRLKEKYGNDIMKVRKPRSTGKKSTDDDAPTRKRTAYIEFVASEMPKVTAENVPHAERMAVISARWNAMKEAKKTAMEEAVSEEENDE
jgi:hypothetical protein